jgi:peptide/nickel transport system substrate-binding protein
MNTRNLSRRRFLWLTVVAVGPVWGACGPASPAAPAANPAPTAAPAQTTAPAANPAPTAAPAQATPAVATKPTAAAAAQPNVPTGLSGTTFTYGNSKPAGNVINPLNTIGTGQNVLIEAMFLRLVYGRQWGDGLNPADSGPIELGVAGAMREIEKDRVWEFDIRPNVKWHDGQPVTADDVIYGIWLALNKNAKTTNETPMPGLKGAQKLMDQGAPPTDVSVEGATKKGDSTVRIELDRPVPNYWVNWSVGYWPMPKHIFGQLPFDKLFDPPYNTMPVGNGPFKAVNYVDGQYMQMAANPDFHLGKPKTDNFIVRFGDGNTLAAAMEAQEIDGMSAAAGPVYDHLTSLPYVVGDPVPAPLPIGFSINYAAVPNPAELTRAISYAIDVATYNKQLASSTLIPSNYIFGHIVGFETPPDGFRKPEYDPDKARALLKQINWDGSKTLRSVIWSPPTPGSDALHAMLNSVGIKTQYKQIDVATIYDQLYRGDDWEIVWANLSGDQDLESVWRYVKCGWNYDQGGFNFEKYCNKDIDTLWQQGLDQTDPAQHKQVFDQISLKLQDAPPQATVWRTAVTYVWNKRVKGAYPYQYRRPVRPALEKVYIQP